MYTKKIRKVEVAKRHRRLRRKVEGTPERPRLAVYRSQKHIYAQLVDDVAGRTIAFASTVELVKAGSIPKGYGVDAAGAVGETIARKAIESGVKAVVYDRGGFIYHGRIAKLAEKAREAGLEF